MLLSEISSRRNPGACKLQIFFRNVVDMILKQRQAVLACSCSRPKGKMPFLFPSLR